MVSEVGFQICFTKLRRFNIRALRKAAHVGKYFISSVCREFGEERVAVGTRLRELGHEPYLSDLKVDLGSPRDIVRENLRASDLVICIFGRSMGHVPESGDSRQLGVTCLEMLWAGEFDVPVYCLSLDCDDRDPQLERFLRQIGFFENGQWVHRFLDPSNLPELVESCVRHFIENEYVDERDDTIDWSSLARFMDLQHQRLTEEQFAYRTGQGGYIKQTGDVISTPKHPVVAVESSRVAEERQRSAANQSGFVIPEFRRPRKFDYFLRRLESSYNPGLLPSTLRTKKIRDITAFLQDSKEITVLQGSPGSGKTTALRYIALQLLTKAMADPRNEAIVPVFLHLNRYGSLQPGDNEYLSRPGRLSSFLQATIQDYCRPAKDQEFTRRVRQSLHTLQKRSQVFFLFDALDELPWRDSIQRQELLRRQAETLKANGNRVVFSCRVADYLREFSAREVLIAPFDRARVCKFVQTHLNDELRDAAPRIVQALLHPARETRQLCQNPFYLQLIVLYLNIVENTWEEIGSLLDGNNLAKVFRTVVHYKFRRSTCRPDSLQLPDLMCFDAVLGRLAVSMFRKAIPDLMEELRLEIDAYTEETVLRVLDSAVEERLLVQNDSGKLVFEQPSPPGVFRRRGARARQTEPIASHGPTGRQRRAGRDYHPVCGYDFQCGCAHRRSA